MVVRRPTGNDDEDDDEDVGRSDHVLSRHRGRCLIRPSISILVAILGNSLSDTIR
jgi:hypothetical protein